MIYLYGASGHAKVVLDLVRDSGQTVAGCIDDDLNKKELLGIPVIHKRAEIDASAQLIVTIGNNDTREKIVNQLSKDGYAFAKAEHNKSILDATVTTGGGTVVMAGAIINASTAVGKHCIINTGCTIDHDCVLDDYVHISPGAHLAGGVTVGKNTHVGIGASIIPEVSIGKHCVIGAGAAVVADVPDYCTVVGVPARIIKKNNS